MIYTRDTRNVDYCVVIFNELIKERAAITLEHNVQQFDDAIKSY